MMVQTSIQSLIVPVLALLAGGTPFFWEANAFCPAATSRSNNKNHNKHGIIRQFRSSRSSPRTELCLWKDLKIPLMDVLDDEEESHTPLPSAHLPAEVATPFLYGMQVDRPVHKLLLEEAATVAAENSKVGPALYGHLVWKDKSSDSLVGAIGCTAQILINAPTTEVLNPAIANELDDEATKAALESQLGSLDAASSSSSSSSKAPPSETPPVTVLCRGAFRFVVKEVIKTIPYPVAIVDEIQDDAEEGDSDMFAVVSDTGDKTDDDDDDDDDNHNVAKYKQMSGTELLQKTMLGIQAIVSQKFEEANAKQTSPLEKQILEESGVSIDPNAMDQARAEEMVAVWEVFQTSLVDDIEPQDRKFAVAIMGVELTDMNNDIRQKVLVTRDREERLRIVLKELDEIVGMARARKLASRITEKSDDDDRDLKVGKPKLPQWAKTIVKGTRIEYFWNEEYGWMAGRVIEDPVTVVDEILLTIRFDDGETHTLPLAADDKVRWRPPEN